MRAAASGLALLVGVLRASASEAPKLDAFIGGLEKGCRPTGTLGAFRAALNARYSFEEGHERLVATLGLSARIGPAEEGAALVCDTST